jgi:ribosomal-protein-alanine N-acetyltransferase
VSDQGAGLAWTIDRVVSERDLDEVLQIESVAFTNPWTREMYLREMDNPQVSFIFLLRIVEDAGPARPVAGFCSFWLIFDELHINNLAVRPEVRRRGIGSALLEHAMQTAARHGAHRATLEVRRSNTAARRLYGRLGFETGGVRKNYYMNPTEDALILWRYELPPARSEVNPA